MDRTGHRLEEENTLIDRMGRKRTLLGLTVVAVAAMSVVAPAAALAQDLTTTSVPDLKDTVDSTTGTVTSGGGGTTSTVTQPIKDTTSTVTQPVKDTTSTVTQPVKDTVDSTTGAVATTGGTVGTVVDKTGDTVDKILPGSPVGTTKKIVEDTTKKTTDSVAGALDAAKRTTHDLGGTVLNPDLSIKNPLNKDKDGDGKVSKKERVAAAQQKTAKIKAALAAERSEKAAGKARDAALVSLKRNRRIQGSPVAAIAPPPRESFLTQLADAAVEATKKLAFPLGLALMVGAFLMVQGRIDRKDAKLALAPIDSEQDLLSFQ